MAAHHCEEVGVEAKDVVEAPVVGQPKAVDERVEHVWVRLERQPDRGVVDVLVIVRVGVAVLVPARLLVGVLVLSRRPVAVLARLALVLVLVHRVLVAVVVAVIRHPGSARPGLGRARRMQA